MKTMKLALLALCLLGGATAGASAQPIVVAPAPPPPAPGVVVIGPGPGLLFVSPRYHHHGYRTVHWKKWHHHD
jgi:hypothetical protein